MIGLLLVIAGLVLLLATSINPLLGVILLVIGGLLILLHLIIIGVALSFAARTGRRIRVRF